MTSPVQKSARALIRPRYDAAFTVVGVVLLLGFALLVFFDLGPPVALNDDWGMAWGARQLIEHHRFAIFPEQSALAIVQSIAAWVFGLGHTDQRVLRLTEVPFIALASWCLYRISRRIGATPPWALVAAALPVALPLSLAMGTTFMTDLPYLGLLLAAGLAALTWLEERKSEGWTVVLVFLAALQRQVGAAIPVAITVALLLAARHDRRLTARDRSWLLATWAATAISLAIPVVFQIAPPTQANRLHGLLHLDPLHILETVTFLPALLGLLCIPLLLGVLFAPKPDGAGAGRGHLERVARVVGAMAVAFLPMLVSVHFFGALFPGDVYGDQNIGPLSLPAGAKPDALPLWLGVVIHTSAILAYTVILGIGFRSWITRRAGGATVFLVALAASQFLPVFLLQSQPYDRYYLPVVAAVWPLLARAASRAPGKAPLAWAIVTMVVGIAAYGIEEQDYQAWQQARDIAAHLAYAQAPPGRVNAGYEANAVYLDIPLYEATGKVNGGVAQGAFDPGLALGGPRHPLIVLALSCQQDQREGVNYESAAPGRVVLLRVGEHYTSPCAHPRQ